MPVTDAELSGIYDALDAMDPQRALRLAEQALAAHPEDAELHFLAGVALDALDRLEDSIRHLQSAVRTEPEDAECRAWLAKVLYRGLRFVEAEEEVGRVLTRNPELVEAHELKGLVLERRGLFGDADRCFAQAAKLDPERCRLPVRLSEEQFEREVSGAIARLPDTFRRHLDEVVVVVEPLPPDSVLGGSEPRVDPETLGLFDGAPLADRAAAELPARVFLFQRNIERDAAQAEISEQIAITLYHELGHYLGLEEDEVEDIGLG